MNTITAPSPTKDLLLKLTRNKSETKLNLSEFIASLVEVYFSEMLKNPQIDQPMNLDIEIEARRGIQNPEVDIISGNEKTALTIKVI